MVVLGLSVDLLQRPVVVGQVLSEFGIEKSPEYQEMVLPWSLFCVGKNSYVGNGFKLKFKSTHQMGSVWRIILGG